MSKCFISYSRENTQWVDTRLSRILRSLDVDYFIDRNDIPPGVNLPERIKEGIRSSDWFIMVASQDSVGSEWVKAEINFAHTLEHLRNRILMIKIDDCDPTIVVSRLNQRPVSYLDCSVDATEAICSLISLLKRPLPRVQKCDGRWDGHICVCTEKGDAVIDYGAVLTLKATADTILGGSLELITPNDVTTFNGRTMPKSMEFRVHGEMRFDRFLHLHYSAGEGSNMQFGSAIFQLGEMPEDDGISGLFVAYGTYIRRIIHGVGEFKRTNDDNPRGGAVGFEGAQRTGRG
ncbi:MAG: toll/interleukin-1 receptor domain-containing protein [Luteolibacter sp.]|uniref:toll/interleukin-1 receptor domain-containing protein n=1 Tax=Luteolibacter sp. TaxID=1962973 RepID=UPI0032636DEB